MPVQLLVDRFLASVQTDERTTFFDTKVTGLAFRVTPAGGKSWAFKYRLAGAAPQWITMGSYPAMTLKEARDQAGRYRKRVDVDRRDPAAEMKAKAAAAKVPPPPAAPVFTIEKLAKVYIPFAKGRKKTWYDDERQIKKHILPAWKDLAVRDITRAHVAELLDASAAAGLGGGINQLQMLISRLFTVALDRGLVDAHPAARMIKRYKVNARSRVLSDAEIRTFREKLDAAPGEAADAVWLRLLLGQRGEETAGMLWTEVNLDERTWFLDGLRTKNNRPHLIALPPMAYQIIERRRAAVVETDPRVFPSLSLLEKEARMFARPWGIRTLAAIPIDMKFDFRDLRRTFATRLAELGVGEDTIGRLLNHARYGVTGKHYNHYKYLPEKRIALDTWDRELTRILKNEPKTSNVIPMPAR